MEPFAAYVCDGVEPVGFKQTTQHKSDFARLGQWNDFKS